MLLLLTVWNSSLPIWLMGEEDCGKVSIKWISTIKWKCYQDSFFNSYFLIIPSFTKLTWILCDRKFHFIYSYMQHATSLLLHLLLQNHFGKKDCLLKGKSRKSRNKYLAFVDWKKNGDEGLKSNLITQTIQLCFSLVCLYAHSHRGHIWVSYH